MCIMGVRVEYETSIGRVRDGPIRSAATKLHSFPCKLHPSAVYIHGQAAGDLQQKPGSLGYAMNRRLHAEGRVAGTSTVGQPGDGR